MMNLKEMSESVAMRLQRDGYEAEVTSAMKNSVSKMAIVVNAGNDTVRPIFYTEDLMKCLDNVMDLDSMIEKMEDMIIKCLQQDNNSLDTNKALAIAEKIKNWSSVKNNVRVCLRRESADKNVIKITFLGMEAYVRIFEADKDGVRSIIVTPQILKSWGITENELWTNAISNTRKTFTINDMEEVFKELGVDIIDQATNEIAPDIMVVTNREKINGAGILFDFDTMNALCHKYNTSFVVLPSSIHEFLLFPYKPDMPGSFFTNMVREVNQTQVVPEEQLADTAFVFKKDEGLSVYNDGYKYTITL